MLNKFHLSVFFLLYYFQSGALMDVAQQNPVMKYVKQVSLERIFSFVLLSKRRFDGCCAAKSSRENLQTKNPKPFHYKRRSAPSPDWSKYPVIAKHYLFLIASFLAMTDTVESGNTDGKKCPSL
jgi:hypothetical protein